MDSLSPEVMMKLSMKKKDGRAMWRQDEANSVKGYYTDNHNRDDIVQYRKNEFLPRMLRCYEKMDQYDGKMAPLLVEKDGSIMRI